MLDKFRRFLLERTDRTVLRDLALLLLRLGAGLPMALTHGLGTLEGLRRDPSSYPDPLGLGSTASMALMVFAELGCALAVAAGFLTRLALIPLVFGLGVAVFVFHAGDPFGHRELAYLYLVIWSVLLLAGPGRFSLDRLLGSSSRIRPGPSRRSVAAGATLACLLLPSSRSVADLSPEPSITLESFSAALSRVESALEAIGGSGALRKAGGISVVGRGRLDLTARMQGMHPRRETWVDVREELAVDPESGLLAYETHGRVNPDADEWIRYVYHDRGRLLIVLRLLGRAFWVPAEEDHRQRLARGVPHLLLEEALAQRHTLRHLGTVDGEAAVTLTLPTGEDLTLLLDEQSNLLRGVEYLLDVPLQGDTAIRWRFDAYREVEGLGRFPEVYRIYQGERLLKEIHYEAIVTGTVGAAVLAEPPGIPYPEPPPPREREDGPDNPADEAPEVKQLAEGVYVVPDVRGGFHALFVELEEFVVAVEAPAGYHELQMIPAIDWAGNVTSSSVGRRLLNAIRRTVPGKPVRYVVLTHHHGDHVGGIRPFLDAGATVLVSETTAEVVELAAGATFALAPDELSRREVLPRVEVVKGERVLGGGARSVRVVDVGPNPHSEGMLVVYLPQEGILYQSDLFFPSTRSFPDPARLPVMRWFVSWLDGSGLRPTKIYSIHGSMEATAEQLEAVRSD